MAKTQAPLDLIRKGIETGDWKLVTQGYAKMTGEKLAPPKAAKTAKAPATIGDVPAAIVGAIEARALEPVKAAVAHLVDTIDLGLAYAAEPATPDDTDEHEHEDVVEKPSPDDDNDQPTEENEGPIVPDEAEAEPAAELSKADRIHQALRMEQFQIDQGRGPMPRENGETAAHGEPIKPGQFKNRFVDDLKLARKELEVDKKLTASVQPTDRRPPASNKKVKMTCSECQKKFTISILDVPPKVMGEDPLWRCESCLTGVGRG